MKIKKVEIEAFRAYNEMNEGTFDFELESNEIANFVSIYAPNGFGKTSFYDAIEWSYTNRITRLDKSHLLSKIAKSERDEINVGGRQEQYILKNKNSSKEQGTVNLYIDNKTDVLSRKTPKIGKGQSDYKFNKQPLEQGTEPFQEVILSQEWIDAFLREDNPQTRYEKFTTAFGEEDIENQYKIIRELIKKNHKEIEIINIELKKLEKILNEELDDQLLNNINNTIKDYNDLGGAIAFIELNMSDHDFVKFSDRLTDEKEFILETTALISDNLRAIKAIEFGDEHTGGIVDYYKNKDDLIELSKRVKLLTQAKNHINDLIKYQNQEKKYAQDLNVSEKLKDNLLDLKSKYSKYAQLRQSINSEKNRVEENNKKIEELRKFIENKAKDVEKSLLLKENKENMLHKHSELLRKLPSLIKEIKSLTTSKESSNKNILNINEEIRKNRDKESKLNVEINELNSILENLRNNQFFSLPAKYSECNSKDLKILSDLLISIKGAKEKIEKISDKIDDTRKFKKELSEFVKKGHDIVNDRKMTRCPLCEHEYFEFENLSEKISRNSFIDESLQKVLQEKEEFFKSLKTFESTFNTTLNSLINPIIKDLNQKRKDLELVKRIIQGKKMDVKKMDETIKEVDSKIVRIKEDYSYLNAEKPEELLSNKIQDLQLEIKNLNEKIETSSKLLSPDKEKLAGYENTNKVLNEKINTFITNEDYKLFKTYISNNPKEGQLEEVDLDQHLGKITKEIKKNYDNHISRLANLIKINDQLSKFEIDKVDEELESLKLKIQKKNNEIKLFVKEINKLIKEVTEDLSQEDLIIKVDLFKEQENKKLEKNKQKDVLLTRIAGYKENVQPFLKYAKAKEKSQKLTNKREYLSNKIESQLKGEKNNLENHIKKHIDSFFYQELINTLYQKIDPHPDYKEISFKCEFPNSAGEKPKLNVFVEDKKGNKHIPSLYFSAAQQNILCLSIFLAKALHATDSNGESINCIFIDDPIQSMDSINVLSTIDLFRSIIVNLDKQIILSTHDQNFQNLLKKKIPEGTFNARYIELESFGKVKC